MLDSEGTAMTEIAWAELVMAQMIRLIVQYPERVTSVTSSTASGKTIHIGVDKEDLGSVVGKKGQTARSIRVILAAISARVGQRIMIDIVETICLPRQAAESGLRAEAAPRQPMELQEN